MRTRVFGLLLLMAGGIMFAQTSSTKSLSISVTAPGSPTGNLLTGKTPANYTLPSGWNLACTQDFDGATPSGCLQGSGTLDGDMPISTAKSHSGTKSWIKSAQATDGNKFTVTPPGSGRELYVSFYQLYSPGFTNGDGFYYYGGDFYTVHFSNPADTFGPVINYCCAEPPYGWDLPPWGANNAMLLFQREPMDNIWIANQTAFGTVIPDHWYQWEVHYKANAPGASDGILEVYIDGVAQHAPFTNADLNGTSNMAGMRAIMGGTNATIFALTNALCTSQSQCGVNSCEYIVNQEHGPYNCPTGPHDPALSGRVGCVTNDTNPKTFAWINSKCAGQAPPHEFWRYIDDVIVLYK